MAADLGKLSIVELEALISNRKSKLTPLYKRRDQLTKQLAALDAQIAAAEGSGAAGRGKPPHFTRVSAAGKRRPSPQRAQNDKSLKSYIEEALAASKKGLTISEIQSTVLENGYVTNSANFKNTLYQCLYHNDKTFTLNKQTKAYKLSGK